MWGVWTDHEYSMNTNILKVKLQLSSTFKVGRGEKARGGEASVINKYWWVEKNKLLV